VDVDFLVVFLCFLVEWVVPSFFSVDELLVSTDSVFLVSVAAWVGLGAGAADCWAMAATGSPKTSAITRDFFMCLLLFAMPCCSALREERYALEREQNMTRPGEI
jgi:hypothetical protein